MPTQWNPIFVHPNIHLHDAIEGTGVAIVPPKDLRLALQTQPHLRAFIEGFRMPHGSGRPIHPAVLIYECEVGTRPDLNRVSDFRNLAAFALLTRSRASEAPTTSTLFADAFEPYPYMVATDGGFVLWNNPNMGLGLHFARNFTGQPSPYFNTPFSLAKRDQDEFILNALNGAWVTGESYWRRRIFRSLEMAYTAASSPHANLGQASDWGVAIALWVSAFEILAHPGDERNVDFSQVADLIEGSPWASPLQKSISPTQVVRNRRRREWESLLVAACKRLYDLRNSVLHGNLEAYPPTMWEYVTFAILLLRGLLIHRLNEQQIGGRPQGEIHRYLHSSYEALYEKNLHECAHIITTE